MNRGRRRFLRILAAAPTVAVVNSYGIARENQAPRARELHSWRGLALGADARIHIAHEDTTEGQRLLRQCQAEIEVVESLFSLHRHDSVITRLNAKSVVSGAPRAFLDLLRTSKDLFSATSGYFDPSVQPLWEVYAAAVGPEFTDEKKLLDQISECRSQVGFHHVDITTDGVAMRRPGMALTLNGIAQGYLTDRVVALLRRADIRSALVETGETYGLGGHPSGRHWQLGVPDPTMPARVTRVISLEDRAVATSAPSGTVFDRAGRFHHLFDPHTGLCATHYSSMTVTAPSAAAADALSTAFSAMPRQMILDTVGSSSDIGVHMVDLAGRAVSWGRA